MTGNAGFPILLKDTRHFRRSTTSLGSDRHLTRHRVAFARPPELEVERGHDLPRHTLKISRLRELP